MGPDEAMAEIEQIQTPKEGGVLTFLKGHLWPMKGFVSKDDFKSNEKVKDFALLLVRIAHKFIKPQLKDPKLYCPAVRELYRTLSVGIEREPCVRRKKIRMFRDVICFLLEKDPAHKYRLQDLANVIDLEKIKFDEGDKEWVKRRREDHKYNYEGKIPPGEWEAIMRKAQGVYCDE